MKKTIVAAMTALIFMSCSKGTTPAPAKPVTVDSAAGKWVFFHTFRGSLPGGGSNYTTEYVGAHQLADGHYELSFSVRPFADRPWYMDGDTLKCDYSYQDEEYDFRFYMDGGQTRAYYVAYLPTDTTVYTSVSHTAH